MRDFARQRLAKQRCCASKKQSIHSCLGVPPSPHMAAFCFCHIQGMAFFSLTLQKMPPAHAPYLAIRGNPPAGHPPSEVRLRLTSDRGSAPTPTVAVLCTATVGYPMPPSNQMCTSIIIMTPVHEVLTAAFPRASRPWTPLARIRRAHTVWPHWVCSTVGQYRVRQPYRRAPGTPSRLPGP